MKPVDFKFSNKVLNKPEGKTDEECGQLPVYTDGEYCISRWKMSFMERLSVLFTGKVWVWVWYGSSQPPINLTTNNPLKPEK